MTNLTLWLTFGDSNKWLDANFDENEFFLLNLSPTFKVLFASLLSLSMVFFLIGKYALIRRITNVGFHTRPINLLMTFDEVICTFVQSTIMGMILFVLATGMSIQSIIDEVTNSVFGLTLPFCQMFDAFQIFGHLYAPIASFHIALFRWVIVFDKPIGNN